MGNQSFVKKDWSVHEVQRTALALCIAVNVSVIIWGSPGSGKTSVLSAIAKANDLHLETVIASTKEPPDFAGFPYLHEGVMRLAPPLWSSNVVREFQENRRKSMVFFDEISTTPPATQAAALTTILDRKTGETQMPMQTRMVAAANPPKMAANGWDLAPPMANRFTHLDWELDAETIARGFQVGWDSPEIPVVPRNFPAMVKKAQVLVGSFIKRRPEMVAFDFDHWSGNTSSSASFKASNNAWPSSRSWSVAARLFAASQCARIDDEPLNPEITRILLEGTVGVQATTEFLQYVAKLDLPNPEKLLQNPSSWECPARGDQISATLASVYHEAIRHIKSESYPQIWDAWGDIIAIAVSAGKSDVALSFAQDWLKSRPAGAAMKTRHSEAFAPLFKQFSGIS